MNEYEQAREIVAIIVQSHVDIGGDYSSAGLHAADIILALPQIGVIAKEQPEVSVRMFVDDPFRNSSPSLSISDLLHKAGYRKLAEKGE